MILLQFYYNLLQNTTKTDEILDLDIQKLFFPKKYLTSNYSPNMSTNGAVFAENDPFEVCLVVASGIWKSVLKKGAGLGPWAGPGAEFGAAYLKNDVSPGSDGVGGTSWAQITQNKYIESISERLGVSRSRLSRSTNPTPFFCAYETASLYFHYPPIETVWGRWCYITTNIETTLWVTFAQH